jgi:hypothetical protein
VRTPFLHAHPEQLVRSGSLDSERFYVGRRPESTEVYVVTRSDVERLPHRAYRSRAAFDWGRQSPGTLELAFALLAHAAGSGPPHLVCTTFCDEVVARLDGAGFMLSDGDIALWMLTAFRETAEPLSPRQSLGRSPVLARVLARLRSPWRH